VTATAVEGRPDVDTTTERPDKRPGSPLAGAYGHPIHPILVTVPIGAWIASLVFDIASRVGEDPDVFATGARWLVAIGIIGALLAALWGLLDYVRIERGTPAFRTGTMHLLLNDVVLVLFIVSWVLRLGDDDEATSMGLIVLSIVALALLSVSGWLGGKLAYRFGVRVADDRTQAEGYTSTASGRRTAGRGSC
jgi:uncharacterized membrane protein